MAISVTHREVDGWPKEVYSLEGFAGERKLHCAWSDRHTLATELLFPPNNIYPYNSTGAMVTHLPKVEGLRRGKQSQGNTSALASYETAVLLVNYSTFGLATGVTPSQLLISEWTETWSETKTLDRTKFQWKKADGTFTNLGPSEGPSKLEPGMDYVLMYHNLAFVPNAVTAQPGTVNSGTANTYLLGISFPAETIMYMGAVVKHRTTTGGNDGYTVRYRFRYAPHVRDGVARGWNWHWNTENARYEPLYDMDGNVTRPYETSSFAF